MPSPKRVLVRCYEPIAVDPTYRQPWGDVWIRFKAKPGRRVYTFGPTLISRPEVERDLEMHRRMQDPEEAKELDAWMEEMGLRLPTDSAEPLDWSDKIAQDEALLTRLDREDLIVETLNDPGIPNLYTPAEFIDRAEAERMLASWMAGMGHRQVKFKWLRPELIVIPA